MSLAFDFGEQHLSLRQQNGVKASLAAFESLMTQDGSPIRAIRHQTAAQGDYSPVPSGLDSRLHDALRKRGIDQLYTHQAEALELSRAGKNVAVVTPTASGKTLCYNLPVLHALLADPTARALYLFPTKALAEDQRQELYKLTTELGGSLTCHTYDGDTPSDVR